ncbi:hypothetical protein [Pseudomonas fluorescens]|uniref:hypothetical protein n=1 Tax=Pseudomonas fluorescens TaxID=294 RepID=UPI000642557D|nr:hypothetical protein [Pseudomonas fluorescens]
MKVVKVMPDYQCFPLRSLSPDSIGNVDPEELPISQELKADLMSWVLKYDDTLDEEYPPDSGFSSEEDEAEFNKKGEHLFERLKVELKGYVVVLK